jgi:hypothetical protein
MLYTLNEARKVDCVSKEACSSDEINCFFCDHRFNCDYCDLIWITASRVVIGLLSTFIWSSHLRLDLHSGLFRLSLPTCIHFSLIMLHTQPIPLDLITLLTSDMDLIVEYFLGVTKETFINNKMGNFRAT